MLRVVIIILVSSNMKNILVNIIYIVRHEFIKFTQIFYITITFRIQNINILPKYRTSAQLHFIVKKKNEQNIHKHVLYF